MSADNSPRRAGGGTMPKAHIKALDLFAGTGWGVACQWLGIKESGVEIMDEAVATREANGMETIYRDVWDGLELTAEQHQKSYGSYGILIASPPCQTFSLAGKGAGRAALNDVLEAIELHAYKDALALRAFGEKHDPRTALVLTPLAYVWRDRPRLVALEQVPTVLPVWEACAEVMREWGYDVKVEILNAEQYGVPQTRKRAILVARRGGPVHMPIPTHSKYYSTNPTKLDPGVQKWISMAEALGWGDARGSVAKGVQPNSPMRSLREPAVTLAFGHDSASFIRVPEGVQHADLKKAKADGTAQRLTVHEAAALQSYPIAIKNMGKGMVERHGDRPGRTADQPAFTIRASAGGMEPGGFLLQEPDGESRKLSPDEASALQSYPGDIVFRNGNQANAARRPLEAPAPTIMFGARSNKVEWIGSEEAKDPSASGDRVTVYEAAALQSYPAYIAASGTSCQVVDPRPTMHPAPTITGAGNAEFGERATRAAKADDRDPSGRRLTPAEASTIQTYEKPFVWCGTKTKQFLQIGNAVPPVLAEAVLAALIGVREGR